MSFLQCNAIPCNAMPCNATQRRGFVTEINAFGYESCYASYKGGEQWRQGMLKVREKEGTDMGLYVCMHKFVSYNRPDRPTADSAVRLLTRTPHGPMFPNKPVQIEP
jgi:hypothetical protein